MACPILSPVQNTDNEDAIPAFDIDDHVSLEGMKADGPMQFRALSSQARVGGEQFEGRSQAVLVSISLRDTE